MVDMSDKNKTTMNKLIGMALLKLKNLMRMVPIVKEKIAEATISKNIAMNRRSKDIFWLRS